MTSLGPAWPERAAWGTAPSLRAWQSAAMTDYFARSPKDYLAVATPGAGKTTFALSVAAELLGRRIIDRVTVVAPTEHLKLQWAEAAARAGIPVDPTYSAGKGKTSKDYVGIAVTYAGVAVNPLAMRIRTDNFKTLVILDEVHHAGDALSWGEGVREAFQPATRRLALTGTPFRSDINPIPFVTYAPGDDGVPRSLADYNYGYAHALADHVVRPVLFMAYSGEMQWRTRAGDEIAARLGEPLTNDLNAQALRTALDPAGSWIPAVLAAADKRLSEVRRHVPDAGGLVIATDQDSARAYAALLKQIAGEAPTVVLSDEKAASRKIRSSPTPTRAGWLPSGWCPRASTCRAWRSASMPRPPRPRCSSPRPWAGSCGPAVAARRRRSSCPRCRSCWAGRRDGGQRDHVLGRLITDEADLMDAEDELLGRAEAGESASDDLLGSSRRWGRRRPSTRRCSTAPTSGTRARCTSAPTRRWTSSASRGCSSPTRCARCCASARTTAGRRPPSPSRTPSPRSRRTSSWPSCAASSTAWSPPGTTAPARPTG